MKRLLFVMTLLLYVGNMAAQVSIVSEKMIDSLIDVSYTDSLYHFEQSKLTNQALRWSQSIKYPKGIYYSISNFGRIAMNLGQYQEAILKYQEALKYAESIDSLSFQARSKYHLGNVYHKLKQFNNSLKNFEESVSIFEKLKNKRWMGIVKNGIGTVYLQLNENEKGTAILTESLNLFAENGFEQETGIVLSNLAEQYYDKQQFEIALQYYQKSLMLAEKFKDIKGQAIGLANIGLVMRELKQYDKSIQYSSDALAISKEYQYNKLIVDFSKDLAETHKELGDYKTSVEYYETFNLLSDSLLNNKVKQEVDALQLAYEKEREEQNLVAQEQEIIALKQERQLSLFANAGILLFALFGGTFLWLFFSRNKAKRQLIEEKLKNQELEKERLEKELNFKTQDLTNFALDISRKNDFAQRLHDRLETLMESNPKEIKEKARKLYFLVANHLKINEDAKQFQMNIDTVNQDFYNKLNEKFPDLTSNEKQLCGLIRLNLTTKDIAAIKNISPKSVEMGRYRLRKKMQLDPKVEMSDFMQKL